MFSSDPYSLAGFPDVVIVPGYFDRPLVKDHPEPPDELHVALIYVHKYIDRDDGTCEKVPDWDRCYWGGIGDVEMCEPAM